MYVASNKSKIAHDKCCPYCKRIKEDNRKEYSHTDDAIDDGYVLCQHCSYVSKKYKIQKERIEWKGKIYKLRHKVADGMLVINDGMSKWKIFFSTKRRMLMVYHQNYLHPDKENDKSPIPGYHFQNFETKHMLEVFDYINDHFHAYLNNYRLPIGLQNRAKSIFYDERNHKRPRSKKKNIKKEKRLAKGQAVNNVLNLIAEIQKGHYNRATISDTFKGNNVCM